MKYYKTQDDQIFAFELDGSQDHLIQEGMIRISRWDADILSETKVTTTWEDIKKHRNKLLAESDWTDLPSSPVPNRPAWLGYRQQLRDLTKNFKTPLDVVWPQPPR